MKNSEDPTLPVLNQIVRTPPAAAAIADALERVTRELDASANVMAWEVVPLGVFGNALPAGIRSCWIFVIRAGAATGAERHPNSHQRSFSLMGSGTFELRVGADWRPHALASAEPAPMQQRWVTIPPSTWHRLFSGSEPWGMVSFHTVAPEALIEERPADANDLEGATHQERYAGRKAIR